MLLIRTYIKKVKSRNKFYLTNSNFIRNEMRLKFAQVYNIQSKVPFYIALCHEQLTSKVLRYGSGSQFYPHVYPQVE